MSATLAQVESARQLVEAKQQAIEWKAAYERVCVTVRKLQDELDSREATTTSSGMLGVLLSSKSSSSRQQAAGGQDMVVLQEELQRRISENQSLHMTMADMRARHEHDMSELKRMLDVEERRVKRTEQTMANKLQEHNVLEEQNRTMMLELARLEKAYQQNIDTNHVLARINFRLERRVQRWVEIASSSPVPASMSVMASLGDVECCFEWWFRQTNSPRGFMERMAEVRRVVSNVLVGDGSNNGNNNNDVDGSAISNLLRAGKATFKSQPWFLPKMQIIMDELLALVKDCKWADIPAPLLLLAMEFTASHDPSLLDVGHEIEILSAAVQSLMAERMVVKQPQSTTNAVPVTIMQTAGEEEEASAPPPPPPPQPDPFLNDDDDCFVVNTPPPSLSLPLPTMPVLGNKDNDDDNHHVPTTQQQMKKLYHSQCIELIRARDEAERRVESTEQRITMAEGRIKALLEERARNVKVLGDCKNAMRQAREELQQTRTSYDQQLQLLSGRVIELETELKTVHAHVDNLVRENNLLNKLKQERFFKS